MNYTHSDTVLSGEPEPLYRMRLERHWKRDGLLYLFSGVNPSFADHRIDDQTAKKWTGFTDRNGGRGWIAVNPFALRSTDVTGLSKVVDPVGPENLSYIRQAISEADVLVPCWGRKSKVPAHLWHHVETVKELFLASGKPIRIFGLNKCGQPKHPQMLGYNTPLVEWQL